MKNIQKYRFAAQILGVALTAFGILQNYRLFMTLIVAVTIVGGAYFCGWICPFGSLQEWFGEIGNLLKIKKRTMPAFIHRYLKLTRYILALHMTILAVDFLFTLLAYDPRTGMNQLLTGRTVSISLMLVMAVFLVLSMFFERPFCQYLCIEGAKMGVLNTLRVATIKREDSTCINCKKCNRTCPMAIDVASSDQLRSLQCINCFQCVNACPIEDTLTYGLVQFTKPARRFYYVMIPIVFLIFSIHTIYGNQNGYGLLPMDYPEFAFLQEDANQVVQADQPESETPTHSQVETPDESQTDTPVESQPETPVESQPETPTETQPETPVESQPETPPAPVEETNTGIAAGLPDGVYVGEGDGFNWTMYATVTVKDGQIVDMEFDHVDDYKWFQRAYNKLFNLILSEQTTDLDTVSGATYSSRGILESVQNAINSGR